MRPCIPATSAPSATGRQSRELQKGLACPKARPNRSRHRFAAPLQRGGPLHQSASRRLSLWTVPGPFLFWQDRAPHGGERRSAQAHGVGAEVPLGCKGAGAVFAVHGNGAERTLRRRHGGASRWTSPPWPGRPIHAPRMLTDPPATAAWTCTGVRPARGRVLRWEWCGAGCPPPPGPGW